MELKSAAIAFCQVGGWHHSRRVRAIAGVLLAGAVLLPAQASLALAANPVDAGTAGIQVDPNGPRTPAQLGYTQAYADAKNAQFAKALQARMSTFASTGGIAPAAGPVPMTGSSNSLAGFTEYHQKTQSWCLPATAQGILAWNFGTSTYVGSGVAASQQAIANFMGNYTDDAWAFAYINGQFNRWGTAIRHGSSFKYVPINDKASLSSFETRLTAETTYWVEPLYVRVDVSSKYYAWTQGLQAYHATISIGYEGSGSSADIGDPYTDPQHTSNCQATPGHYPGYSSASDVGCIYHGYSSSYYWTAMTGVVNNESPEYY